MEERNSFTFYLSFERAIARLDDANQLLVYRAVSRYSLFGEAPQVDGLAAVAWELIKPILDKSRARSANGKKAKGVPKPGMSGNKNKAKSKLNQNKIKAKSKQDRDKDRDRDKDKDRNNIGDKSPNGDKPCRFVPPSLGEINEYINEKKYNVDAGAFMDFYQSKGWMVGKNKMKDWRAAVRTWNRKQSAPGKAAEIGVILRDNSAEKYKHDKLC